MYLLLILTFANLHPYSRGFDPLESVRSLQKLLEDPLAETPFATQPAKKNFTKFLPLINLKRWPDEPKDYHKINTTVHSVVELECSETMFMSPYHYPVQFNGSSSIYDRIDKSCKWTFVGTDPCIPKISCDYTHTQDCYSEYIEIMDGNKGYMKVCPGQTVQGYSAAHDLRDIYLHFNVIKPPTQKRNGKEVIFNCTVTCSNVRQATPLPLVRAPRINPKCYCGTKPNDNRIVGGEDAKKSEFPWLVALVETNTRQPFCGGSIINNLFILTAGHCIKGKYMDYRNIQVIVNGHGFDSSPNLNIMVHKPNSKVYELEELQRLDSGNGSLRLNIDEIIVHPLYVSETNDFDVSLLRLQTPLDLTMKAEFGKEFQPPRSVCLPELGSYLRTYSNKKALIAGWGLPDIEAEGTPLILQKLGVNVFSPKVCKSLYAHRVNRRMLCAGHREGGKDACSGDSGGPLVVEDRPKVWYQIASVSWGEGCAVAENPGVYFRTTESAQWAHYHSNNNNATWCLVP